MASPEYRTFDGSDNNVANPDWGRVGTQLLRKTTPSYEDGVSSLAKRGGIDINPREISNIVCQQTKSKPNPNGLSNFVWAWGQFLDHEIDLTGGADPTEPAPISLAPGDPQLPSGGTIPFNRSVWDTASGTDATNPRQQVTQLSAYIDATNVYGSSVLRASALRVFDGTGRLKVTDSLTGDLLPYNIAGLPNAALPGTPAASLFVAGDVRANEHAVLTSMHALFVREHNRLCLEILAHDPILSGNDEAIYQLARKIVGGQMQVITYNEFIPALLGPSALKPYNGYDDTVDASIVNIFSTACYRLGHSMLSSVIDLGTDGRTLDLRDAFFDPDLVKYNGIEPFLSGLATQVMQDINTQIVEDVRSFLFGPPNTQQQSLLDLGALNIQRGRDHGLPDYNQCRVDCGLAGYTCFSDITHDNKVQEKLEKAYVDMNNIDPWIGGLAEDHLPGTNVGELIFTVLKDQFERLRDGDRFWYENDQALSAEQKDEMRNTRLSDIIRRNITITNIPDDVFVIEAPSIALKKAS